MSIVIFFSMALFILLLGLTVVSATFYNWYKLAKEAKLRKIQSGNLN
jgi:hypothetical protein